MDHIEYMLTTDEKLMRVKFYNTEPGTSEMDDLFDLVIERLLLYLEDRVIKYDPSIDIYNDIIVPGISLQHFIFLNVRRTFYNLKRVKSTPILGYIFRKGLYYFVWQQCGAARHHVQIMHAASFGCNEKLFRRLNLNSKYKIFDSRCKNNIMYIFEYNTLIEVRYNCDNQKLKQHIDTKQYGFTFLNKVSAIFFEKLSSVLYVFKKEFKKSIPFLIYLRYIFMRSLLYIFLILNISSCRDAKRVDPLIQDELENRNKTIEQKDKQHNQNNWDNPVLIGGTSFGNIINVNYQLGLFDELYRLTNSTLKSSLSKQDIINKYRNLPMGFDLDFPINKTDENGIIWLHYSAEINATKKIMRMPVVVEDDTCRLMLLLFENELNRITVN